MSEAVKADATVPIGVGEVLDRRRAPDDPTIPRIVEFRNVTKT